MTTDYTKIGEAFAAIADLRRYTIDNGYAKMRVAIDGEGPKHWAARVWRDRGQKGGIARGWLTRGDNHWYHVAYLKPGDVVEIGASAYSLKRLMKAGENPDRTKRLYRQVAAVTEECLLFVAVDDERGSDRWREVAAVLDGTKDDQGNSAEDAQVQSVPVADDKAAAISSRGDTMAWSDYPKVMRGWQEREAQAKTLAIQPLTPEEQRWIKRLRAVFRDMPARLRLVESADAVFLVDKAAALAMDDISDDKARRAGIILAEVPEATLKVTGVSG
jgi:hypothetical protein